MQIFAEPKRGRPKDEQLTENVWSRWAKEDIERLDRYAKLASTTSGKTISRSRAIRKLTLQALDALSM